MSVTLEQNQFCRRMLAVLRDRETKQGPVLIPQRKACLLCSPARPKDGNLRLRLAQEMRRIQHTGVVANVMDCVCEKCAVEYAEDLRKLARIVCVGCREVVALLEPFKEPRGGFEWEARRCYHIADCPVCSGDPRQTASHVIEKIQFYKANKIPYETGHG